MNNQTILYYVIRILIVLAQTSEMPYAIKQVRVDRLNELAREVGLFIDKEGCVK